MPYQRILVVRPEPQASQCVQLLQQQGISAIAFPMLEVVPLPSLEKLEDSAASIEPEDMVVFVSQNAVQFGMTKLDAERQKQVLSAHLYAVGQSTANALQPLGANTVIYPDREANSEALFAQMSEKSLSGRRVWIFRGIEGREWLCDQLLQAGADVQYIPCYQSQCPTIAIDQLLAVWDEGIDLIFATSVAVIQNLAATFGSTHFERLQETPITVLSERMNEAATSLGLSKAIMIPSANNQRFCQWLLSQNPPYKETWHK